KDLVAVAMQDAEIVEGICVIRINLEDLLKDPLQLVEIPRAMSAPSCLQQRLDGGFVVAVRSGAVHGPLPPRAARRCGRECAGRHLISLKCCSNCRYWPGAHLSRPDPRTGMVNEP